MDITANRPAPNARRFEAGTPAVVNCYAAEAGLKFLLAVGTPAIEKRNYALTRRCMQRLEEIGWPSITPTQDERRGATVAVPSRNSRGLSAELMKRDIVTSHRDDNVRASFHFYNNEDDVESFIAAMKDLRRSFNAEISMSPAGGKTPPIIAHRKGFYYEVKAGKRYLWCSCGRSKTQPFCDGSHVGSEFLPIAFKAERDEEVIFCGCKHTGTGPFCDGAHSNLPGGYLTDDPDSAENQKRAPGRCERRAHRAARRPVLRILHLSGDADPTRCDALLCGREPRAWAPCFNPSSTRKSLSAPHR